MNGHSASLPTSAAAREPATSAEYHTALAPDYESRMASLPGNEWVRGAFHALVTEHLPPAAAVLDFGCGTGQDARWLAGRGHRVLAYDDSPGMVCELIRRATTEIERGCIAPCTGPDEDLGIELERRGPVGAVIADFAVLNMICDLPDLFALLASHVEPGGWLIASVLNPFFWQDLLHPAWWRPCLRGLLTGAVEFPTAAVPSYRHLPGRIEAAARPHFELVRRSGAGAFIRYGRGPRDWASPRSLGERLERRMWCHWPLASVGKFLFLAFRRI